MTPKPEKLGEPRPVIEAVELAEEIALGRAMMKRFANVFRELAK